MAGVIVPAGEFTKPRSMAEQGWLEKNLKGSGLDPATAAKQMLPNGDWEYAKTPEELSKLKE